MREINLLCLNIALARAEKPTYANQTMQLEIPSRFAPKISELSKTAKDELIDIVTLIAKPCVGGESRWFEWYLIMS